jgi:integrase
MLRKKVYLEYILDTRRPLTGTKDYPVKLRITHKQNRYYLNIGYHFTKDEFKAMRRSIRGYLRDQRDLIEEVVSDAEEIIEGLSVFNYDDFKKQFLRPRGDYQSVYTYADSKISELKKEDRIGAAQPYENAIVSLKKFKRTKELYFEDITSEFLKSYQRWMTARGRSKSTIGIYLRCLRALYNMAIENGDALREMSPFRKYKIPQGRNFKRALTLEQVRAIRHYQCTSLNMERARDIWMVLYYTGWNANDLFKLKWSSVNEKQEVISYTRSKTSGTATPNTKYLMPEILEVLNKWHDHPKRDNKYIFNVLKGKDGAEEQKLATKQAIKVLNKWVGRIGEDLGFGRVTTQGARHSFATISAHGGASLLYIQRELDHQNLKTTQNYLDSFTFDEKKRGSELLR